MSEKISQYSTSVSSLATGDLMDVSKLISTSPDVYQSQKLNYSVLISELNNDLTFNNLGNSDLTSTANARYFYLNGNTTSNFLKFRNSNSVSMLSLFGDKSIVFGSVANAVTIQFNFSGSDATGDIWYRNSSGYLERLGIGSSGQVLSVSAGLPSWATLSSSNLGSANLTSADNARTFTLKAGGTSSQYLSIESTPGNSLLKLSGDKIVNFGDGSTYIKVDPYGVTSWGILQFCASGTTYAYNVYDSGNAERFRVDTSGRVVALRGSLSTYFNYNSSINFWADGTNSSFHFVGTNGSNHTLYLGNESGHGYAEIKNSSGTTKTRLSGNGDSYFLNNLAVGVSSASALLHIKGAGSTSATTTALFQNSSSSTVAQFKDDLTSTFGGVVTAPQIITTPATVTVAANAGTVTRANRTNNFTNSSAAAMTITISLTGALDGDIVMVRIFDFSAVAQTITWVNTENSTITVPATSNGSTTLPLTVGFQYNGATSKWRCVGSV